MNGITRKGKCTFTWKVNFFLILRSIVLRDSFSKFSKHIAHSSRRFIKYSIYDCNGFIFILPLLISALVNLCTYVYMAPRLHSVSFTLSFSHIEEAGRSHRKIFNEVVWRDVFVNGMNILIKYMYTPICNSVPICNICNNAIER